MRRPPEIRLLGQGLDAIIFAAAHPRTWWEKLARLRARTDEGFFRPLSEDDRLKRYHDAALLRPMYRDPQLLALREHRGWHYMKAWRAGKFPKLRGFLSLVPTLQPQTRRASSARG